MSNDLEQINRIIRQINGSWRLPINDDESITITFFPNGNFIWTISAYSTASKSYQILLGSDMKGNWQVRPERSRRKKFGASSSPSSYGPYLVLNFTELLNSIVNMNLFGFRADIANWINNVLELTRDGHYRILEFSQEEIRLENPEKKIEVWLKASETFA